MLPACSNIVIGCEEPCSSLSWQSSHVPFSRFIIIAERPCIRQGLIFCNNITRKILVAEFGPLCKNVHLLMHTVIERSAEMSASLTPICMTIDIFHRMVQLTCMVLCQMWYWASDGFVYRMHWSCDVPHIYVINEFQWIAEVMHSNRSLHLRARWWYLSKCLWIL